MSLYISTTAVDSSLSDTPMHEAIKSLAISIALEKQQGRVPNGPSLDVTFMLAGKTSKPEFTGMRMGGYTQEGNTLYFEREVPEAIVVSKMAKEYLNTVMQDVISNAIEFFHENNIAFEDISWQSLINRLAQSQTSSAIRE